MNNAGEPQVGEWYQRTDNEEVFQVVSVDAASAFVQVQSFDGQVDDIASDEWKELSLISASEPPDWTGAVEDLEPDDVTEDDSASDRAR